MPAATAWLYYYSRDRTTFVTAVSRRRVVIDSDAKNEADDQYAIVHALLSPTPDVRGLVAAHFGTERTPDSMSESRAEIDLLLRLMELEGKVVVADGATKALADESTPVPSGGARLIIDESMLAGPNDPLFVAFLGPLTDMASAILMDPAIVERDVVVIWIGGMGYGVDPSYDGVKCNLRNDIAAANLVFGSGITVWQVPSSVTRWFPSGTPSSRRESVAPARWRTTC
jgi:inosine-uridine nucleoside N-ribohydrolase